MLQHLVKVLALQQTGRFADELEDFWPLLSHLLIIGELQGAVRLLCRHSAAQGGTQIAPLEPMNLNDSMNWDESGNMRPRTTLAKFLLLLQERLTMPPFEEPTRITMDATMQPGARFDRWRRDIRSLLQRKDFCLKEYAGQLEGILIGDTEVLMRLIYDGAEGQREFLVSGSKGNSHDYFQYNPMRWALFLGAKILYGNLLGAQKHDLLSWLENEPILSLVAMESGSDEQLSGRDMYQMLHLIVCNQEGGNVMVAIKLLYQLPGPAAKMAVALLADLCAHAGEKMLLDPDILRPQMDCCLRERLLLEMAEVLEAGLPEGWRSAAKVLAHCEVHGHHALGELLLRIPVGLPTTPDRIVREVLQYCDCQDGQSGPLLIEQQAICGARASLLLREGQCGAAAYYFLRGGELARLERLCKDAFDSAAIATRDFVTRLGNGGDIDLTDANFRDIAEHRNQLSSIFKAFAAASPSVLESIEANEYEESGIGDDILFLERYQDFLETFIPAVCPRPEIASIASITLRIRKAMVKLDLAMEVAPFGAKPHLLRLVVSLMRIADGSPPAIGSSACVIFPHTILEQLMVALEEFTHCHRSKGNVMCGNERLDDETIDYLRRSFAVRLRDSYIALYSGGRADCGSSGPDDAIESSPDAERRVEVAIPRPFEKTYEELMYY